MYRVGPTRERIAELVRGPRSDRRLPPSPRGAADPGLRPAHEAATAREAKVTAQGLERMRRPVAMVQETGRYPSRTAESTSERSLAVWLPRRGEDARAGQIVKEHRDGFAVLPRLGRQAPGVVAAEERLQEVLTALVEYRAAGNDWPRHKAEITAKNTSWACGWSPSGPTPAAGNSIPRNLRPWTQPSRGGGQAGRAAGGPEPAPEPAVINGIILWFRRCARRL